MQQELISIAICDDEMITCLDIQKKVHSILGESGTEHIIKCFYSGEKLLSSEERFDIIFLDIKMDNLNGIETAKKLREDSCDSILIFVTSAPEYVYKAFDLEAFNYILKPIDTCKLEDVLKRAVNKILVPNEKFIIISQNRKLLKLKLSHIMYFEIMRRVIKAHTKSGTYEFYEQLSMLEEKLSNDSFFRCHRSFLINLEYVASFEKSEIILENGEKIPISKRKFEEFSKVFLNFMKVEGGIL